MSAVCRWRLLQIRPTAEKKENKFSDGYGAYELYVLSANARNKQARPDITVFVTFSEYPAERKNAPKVPKLWAAPSPRGAVGPRRAVVVSVRDILILNEIYHHHHHHWFDSPTWALAFLRSFCQLSFSIATFLQFFTPKVLISWITSSSHLSLGLPIFLIPVGSVSDTS
jgi:hypothetical protein